MNNMQERFKRVFQFLEDTYLDPDNIEGQDVLLSGELNLMWLRNETGLWEDYEEDPYWIINGIQYDPNHPDNLSDSVYKWWLKSKQDFNIKVSP